MSLLAVLLCLGACDSSSTPDAAVVADADRGDAGGIVVTGIREEEVTFTGSAGVTLRGTLTIPQTAQPASLPAVVLLHGSGPSDRDSTTESALLTRYPEPVRPFALLADALGRRGFVVLRYDKRTCFRENSDGRCPTPVAQAEYDLNASTIPDVIEDGASAIRYVAGRSETLEQGVVVVGFSQGGNWVPRLLAELPDVTRAGVLLAAASLRADRAYVRQLRRSADYLESFGDASLRDDIDALRALADDAEESLAAIRAGTFEGAIYQGSPVEFWQDWMTHTDDIRAELVGAPSPILALNGDRDFNVDADQLADYERWIEESGRDDCRALLVPGATHQFMTVEPSGEIDLAFSPVAFAAIDEFLADQGLGAGQVTRR